MKVRNSTDWNTGDLKALCTAVLKHEGGDLKNTQVYVDYTSSPQARFGIVHGKARLHGRIIWMYVPKQSYAGRKNWLVPSSEGRMLPEGRMDIEFPVKTFAQVFTHEVHHNLGLLHEDMASHRSFDVSYALGIQVRAKPAPEPKVRDRAQERAQKIASYEERVKAFESRIKRLKTLQKKYQKRLYALKRAEVPKTISSEVAQ